MNTMAPMEIHEENIATATGPVAATPAAVAPVAASPYPAGYPVGNPTGATVSHRRVGMWPAGYPANQVVWLIAGIIDVILLMDMAFRASGANDTGFGHFIYALGGALASPFVGLFNSNIAGDIVAVVVYSLIAWIITKVISTAALRSASRTTTTTPY